MRKNSEETSIKRASCYEFFEVQNIKWGMKLDGQLARTGLWKSVCDIFFINTKGAVLLQGYSLCGRIT